MSAQYRPIGWTRSKLAYDAVLLAGVAGYLWAFITLAPALRGTALDEASLRIKAYGSCAFILLTIALCIGPLARLDTRFLPLLYNRRHLGVLTFLIAALHAREVLGWHFAFSATPPLVAMLSSEPAPGAGLAFVPMGVGALLILFLLAATSHDFWLAFLKPGLWKALHMLIYAAYALVVAHIGFGQLQVPGSAPLALLVGGGAMLVLGLHGAAAIKGAREEQPAPRAPWLRVGPPASLPEDRAIIIRPADGEAVAVFRHNGRASAISHLCAHQHGPLGEGRVIDGCVTCPWHGYQYRLEDGCAPPPYTEKLATFALLLRDGEIWLDPRPNPPGTRVEPLVLP